MVILSFFGKGLEKPFLPKKRFFQRYFHKLTYGFCDFVGGQ